MSESELIFPRVILTMSYILGIIDTNYTINKSI